MALAFGCVRSGKPSGKLSINCLLLRHCGCTRFWSCLAVLASAHYEHDGSEPRRSHDTSQGWKVPPTATTLGHVILTLLVLPVILNLFQTWHNATFLSKALQKHQRGLPCTSWPLTSARTGSPSYYLAGCLLACLNMPPRPCSPAATGMLLLLCCSTLGLIPPTVGQMDRWVMEGMRAPQCVLITPLEGVRLHGS